MVNVEAYKQLLKGEKMVKEHESRLQRIENNVSSMMTDICAIKTQKQSLTDMCLKFTKDCESLLTASKVILETLGKEEFSILLMHCGVNCVVTVFFCIVCNVNQIS